MRRSYLSVLLIAPLLCAATATAVSADTREHPTIQATDAYHCAPPGAMNVATGYIVAYHVPSVEFAAVTVAEDVAPASVFTVTESVAERGRTWRSVTSNTMPVLSKMRHSAPRSVGLTSRT